MPRKPFEQHLAECAEVHGGKYLYPPQPAVPNNKHNIAIYCPTHDLVFYQTINDHKSGCGCAKCKNDRLIERNRKPFIQHLKECQEKHGGKYLYPPQPAVPSVDCKIAIYCPEHGMFYQVLTNHKAGKGCEKCAINIRIQKRRKKFEQHLKECQEKHGRKYLYPPQPAVPNPHYKVAIYCPIHEEVFYQTLSNHKNGQGCEKCTKSIKARKNRKIFSEHLKECKKIHNGKYMYPPQPAVPNPHYKIAIYCPTHDNVFYQILNDHKNGHGCPQCANTNVSKIEHKLKEHIEQRFNTTVIRGHRLKTEESWVEIDLYLPDYNIGVEVNGSYWHSVEQKPRDYHKQKSIVALENGIELLHWYEDDINNDLTTLLTNLEILIYDKHELPNTKRVFQKVDSGLGCWLRNYGYLPVYWSEPILRVGKRFNYWDSGIIVWERGENADQNH